MVVYGLKRPGIGRGFFKAYICPGGRIDIPLLAFKSDSLNKYAVTHQFQITSQHFQNQKLVNLSIEIKAYYII